MGTEMVMQGTKLETNLQENENKQSKTYNETEKKCERIDKIQIVMDKETEIEIEREKETEIETELKIGISSEIADQINFVNFGSETSSTVETEMSNEKFTNAEYIKDELESVDSETESKSDTETETEIEKIMWTEMVMQRTKVEISLQDIQTETGTYGQEHEIQTTGGVYKSEIEIETGAETAIENGELIRTDTVAGKECRRQLSAYFFSPSMVSFFISLQYHKCTHNPTHYDHQQVG